MDTRADFYGELDLGLLCLTNVVDLSEGKLDNEEKFKALATKGANFILGKLNELPSKYDGDVRVVKLPAPTTVLPREKSIPKGKPLTKWQKFAQDKGITKQKREKLLWDETSKTWKPRYGYRSKANTDKSDWVIEIPDSKNPYEDYYAKAKEKKSENVAKNEYQRLKNIAVANKMKVSTLESVDKAKKDELLRSASTAKASTASLGKFAPKLPKEKAPKNNFKKRKFETNIPADVNVEKQKNLKILEDLNKKRPKLDIKEAVQREVQKIQKPVKDSDASQKPKKQKQKRFNSHKKDKRFGKQGKKDKQFNKKKGKKSKNG